MADGGLRDSDTFQSPYHSGRRLPYCPIRQSRRRAENTTRNSRMASLPAGRADPRSQKPRKCRQNSNYLKWWGGLGHSIRSNGGGGSHLRTCLWVAFTALREFCRENSAFTQRVRSPLDLLVASLGHSLCHLISMACERVETRLHPDSFSGRFLWEHSRTALGHSGRTTS